MATTKISALTELATAPDTGDMLVVVDISDTTDAASGTTKYIQAGNLGFLSDIVTDTTPQLGGTLDANGFNIDMGVNIITDAKVATWDSALLPAAIGVTVQGYDADTAKLDVVQTFTAAQTFGAVTLGAEVVETVYAISGTTPALDPANGTIQTWTLTGASTPTDSLAAGESITLMIDDGTAYTVTWPTMTWVNNAGSAPTLATSGYTVVALWKVSTTLYGALVGDGT